LQPIMVSLIANILALSNWW